MTYKVDTMNGRTEYVHDVISMTRVGNHTYEFLQNGIQGKLRVTEVIRIQLDYSCLCHNR